MDSEQNTEGVDGRLRSVREPAPSTGDRPAWALTELTRTGAALAPTSGLSTDQYGIEWVRPTELAPRIGASVMQRGADAHRDVHGWVRGRVRDAADRSYRARRLAPLSAFGKNGPAPSSGREAIGR
jgi:hypothetical protein